MDSIRRITSEKAAESQDRRCDVTDSCAGDLDRMRQKQREGQGEDADPDRKKERETLAFDPYAFNGPILTIDTKATEKSPSSSQSRGENAREIAQRTIIKPTID